MSMQRQVEIQKNSKLGNSENSWYNIFRKEEVESQGLSEKHTPPRVRQMAAI